MAADVVNPAPIVAGLLKRELDSLRTTVLRWILAHPSAAPYGKKGPRTSLNPGAIKEALNRLMDLELIESFSAGRFSCTTPLRVLAALDPAAVTGP